MERRFLWPDTVGTGYSISVRTYAQPCKEISIATVLSPSRERLDSQPTLLFPASSGRGKAFRERWYKVGGRRSFSHVGSPSQFDKRRVDVAVHEDPGTQVIGLLALG